MIGENPLVGGGIRTKTAWRELSHGKHVLAIKLTEQAIMARSKPKKEKREETTEEFVKRVNKQAGKRNGLRLHYVWQKRRH